MTKRNRVLVAIGLAGFAVAPAVAQQLEDQGTAVPELARASSGKNRADLLQPSMAADVAYRLAPQARWRQTVICSLNRPMEVQRYQVQCKEATRLDARVADCCISGDHWEAKSKNWDRAPNTAVTTSPGPANVFGVDGRVYNYGGTATNPRNINAEVDCTYLNGVDVFPADSFIVLSSDGDCVVTDLGKRDAINRTP
jgi:hypothetical protein